MKIKYIFTSELENIYEKIKFELDSFKKQHSIDNSIAELSTNFLNKDHNPEKLLEDISAVGEILIDLNTLLSEINNILVTCQKDNLQKYLPQEEEPTAANKEEEPPPATEGPNEDQKLEKLYESLSQLGNLSQTLKQLKDNNE